MAMFCLNMLEIARHAGVPMVYASSSSVYGGNTALLFRVEDRVDHPLSLYAATKKADELMSETYAHLYRLPLTGLRFFTVYGPWGRPDMAMWLFTKAIFEDRPIQVFNNGDMRRDFTFIDTGCVLQAWAGQGARLSPALARDLAAALERFADYADGLTAYLPTDPAGR